MDITDRRVVQFREWAERRFAIGSGGYGSEDLLSVVMAAVDARLGVEPRRDLSQQIDEIAMRTGEDPAFLSWLKHAVD